MTPLAAVLCLWYGYATGCVVYALPDITHAWQQQDGAS